MLGSYESDLRTQTMLPVGLREMMLKRGLAGPRLLGRVAPTPTPRRP
jgi:hypothetical protein